MGLPSESPFQGLSEYTPYTLPYGTHSWHKSGNNHDNHRKPTELAHSVPTLRDICKSVRRHLSALQGTVSLTFALHYQRAAVLPPCLHLCRIWQSWWCSRVTEIPRRQRLPRGTNLWMRQSKRSLACASHSPLDCMCIADALCMGSGCAEGCAVGDCSIRF